MGILMISFSNVGFAMGQTQEQTDMVICTSDAKICPDGSYVSRTGPHCEFAPCSDEGDAQRIPEPVMCREDARQCADGSFVARQGVDCEFSLCPDGQVPIDEKMIMPK